MFEKLRGFFSSEKELKAEGSQSEPKEIIKQLSVNLHKRVLKPNGFKKYGNTFNRALSSGMVHVVQLQAGRYNLGGAESIEIEGHEISLNNYGQVRLYFGVYHKALLKYFVKPSKVPPCSETNCFVRYTLGNSDPASGGFYSLTDPELNLFKIFSQRLTDQAFQVFQMFLNFDDVLEYSKDRNNHKQVFFSTDRIRVQIYLQRGDLVSVKKAYNDGREFIEMDTDKRHLDKRLEHWNELPTKSGWPPEIEA